MEDGTVAVPKYEPLVALRGALGAAARVTLGATLPAMVLEANLRFSSAAVAALEQLSPEVVVYLAAAVYFVVGLGGGAVLLDAVIDAAASESFDVLALSDGRSRVVRRNREVSIVLVGAVAASLSVVGSVIHLARAERAPRDFAEGDKRSLLWGSHLAATAMLAVDAFVAVLLAGGPARLLALCFRHLHACGLLTAPEPSEYWEPSEEDAESVDAVAEDVVAMMQRFDEDRASLHASGVSRPAAINPARSPEAPKARYTPVNGGQKQRGPCHPRPRSRRGSRDLRAGVTTPLSVRDSEVTTTRGSDTFSEISTPLDSRREAQAERARGLLRGWSANEEAEERGSEGEDPMALYTRLAPSATKDSPDLQEVLASTPPRGLSEAREKLSPYHAEDGSGEVKGEGEEKADMLFTPRAATGAPDAMRFSEGHEGREELFDADTQLMVKVGPVQQLRWSGTWPKKKRKWKDLILWASAAHVRVIRPSLELRQELGLHDMAEETPRASRQSGSLSAFVHSGAGTEGISQEFRLEAGDDGVETWKDFGDFHEIVDPSIALDVQEVFGARDGDVESGEERALRAAHQRHRQSNSSSSSISSRSDIVDSNGAASSGFFEMIRGHPSMAQPQDVLEKCRVLWEGARADFVAVPHPTLSASHFMICPYDKERDSAKGANGASQSSITFRLDSEEDATSWISFLSAAGV